jgi:signal transduction histidine kinase
VSADGGLLRVLLVEDREEDAELVLRELKRGARMVRAQRVDDAPTLEHALEVAEWDVVLSDYSLPRLDAPTAYEIVRSRHPHLPFIIVSGTVGEDVVVAAMRRGVDDYLLEHNLTRLNATVEREVRETARLAEGARLEERVLLSERMASLGTLAAGVAHELNNPLAVVMTNLELLDASRDARALDQPSTRALLGDVREAVKRMHVIVQDLRGFSRGGGEEQRGPVDLNAVVEASIRLATSELEHRARVVKRLAARLPPVLANESRLGQVVLNLVVNAAQSIDEGRTDAHLVSVTTALGPEGRVVLVVQNTGRGMTPEVLARACEPFYTTKPIGVGTGLGLAICRRIVEDLGGTLQLDSEVDVGTTVHCSLRASARDDGARTLAPSPRPAARRSRILVVDDEALLANALRRSLASAHDVSVMSGVDEALVAARAGERWDVVFCDLMMPQRTGMELHAELLALDPQQAERIVFMTGGAFTQTARDFLASVKNPRLDKPFSRASVDAAIALVLDGPN